MKKLCLMFVMVLMSCTMAWAQAVTVDVVYLKNGSVIRGSVIEQIPNESLKIKTADGSLFVYKMSEVEKITKEEVAKQKSTLEEEENIFDRLDRDKKAYMKSMRKRSVLKRGYKGFFDYGNGGSLGEFKGFYAMDFSVVNGYQINPYVYVGAGVGVAAFLDTKANSADGNWSVPVFFDLRLTPVKKPVTPLVEMRVGNSFGDVSGLYLQPSLGVRIGVYKNLGLNVKLSFLHQNYADGEHYDHAYTYTGWIGTTHYSNWTFHEEQDRGKYWNSVLFSFGIDW